MKVKTLKKFRDLKDNVIREEGDLFICSKERFEEINKTLIDNWGKGPWLEEVKEKDKK